MQIKPKGPYILVQLDTVPDQTASGLYLGSSARKMKQCKGIVTAIGTAVFDVELGDRVILTVDYEPSFCVTNDEQEEFVIVDEEDVCAILTEEGSN